MRLPGRIPILYLILGVLIAVSVVPLYFYGSKVVEINRLRLKTNEQYLQNTIAASVGSDIAQRHENMMAMLANLSSAIQVSSGGNLEGEHVSSPEMRALLEKFVSSTSDVAYATLLNTEKKGVSAGRMATVAVDPFMQRELERAFGAAIEARPYNGQVLSQGAGTNEHSMMLVTMPIVTGGRFVGVVCAFIDLQYLVDRLQEVSVVGLEAYVVDHKGRLVAGGDHKIAIGQDMTRGDELVKNFIEQGQKGGLIYTQDFNLGEGKDAVAMLGTYRPVPSLGWAVVVQKRQDAAYQSVFEMQRQAFWMAIVAIVLAMVVGYVAAHKITGPLAILTESSRAIARGDFSKRVELRSRTEFGELAETFNLMTDDLERFVADLKRAAEENRSLFMSSIQMLAGAVDEKDPYTKGHSDRVTRYSVLLATELGLTNEQVEQIRIAAQLHDVGKIGIEDRILKKPSALTPDEYEIMKTHTTKGATILRPVVQLANMIPGIELHHESLDGRGYPHGLKGDQIPLMPRVITVADTFDAMTTNRPYQAAMDAEYVVRIIASLANTKFDPRVVSALQAVFARGGFRLHRAATVNPEAAAAAAAAAQSTDKFGSIRAGVAVGGNGEKVSQIAAMAQMPAPTDEDKHAADPSQLRT
jgi:HD-GYP domain-containing protein (c-di-GMP phosphodiesterase class II)